MALKNLKAEMSRNGITQRTIADSLSMSLNNFNLKVNERVPMTVDEAREVQSRFFPELTLDYLLESDGNVAGAKERCHAQFDALHEVYERNGWLDEETEDDFRQMHECVDGMAEEGSKR